MVDRNDHKLDRALEGDQNQEKSNQKRPPTLDRKPSRLQRLTSKLRSSSKKGLGQERRRGRGSEGDDPLSSDSSRVLSSMSSLQRGGGGRGLGAGRARGLQDLASTTAARIRMFEEGAFSLENDMGSLSEKGLENLRGDLAQLDGEVLEDLRKEVHKQYNVFIRATPGILRLESEVATLRGQLQSMGQVIQAMGSVSESVAQTQRGGAKGGGQGAGALQDAESAWRASAEGARWTEYLDDCDMAIAERRASEALPLVQKLERLAERAGAGVEGEEGGGESLQQLRAAGLREQAECRRQALVPLAQQRLLQPTASQGDLREGGRLLEQVAGRQQALRVLLAAYSARLKRQQEGTTKPTNSGGVDADGCEYAAALGQQLVLELGRAADDVAAVFGTGAVEGGSGGRSALCTLRHADLAAAFLVWALQETERSCLLLRKHALEPFAAPAGLAAACRCIAVFRAYCAALEASHALCLGPVLDRHTWPLLAQVLVKRIRKAGEALRRSVCTEVDLLADGTTPLPQAPEQLSTWETLAAVLPSADFLLDELETLCGELATGMRLPKAGATLRKAVGELFQGYTAALAGALRRRLKYADTEAVQDRLAQGIEVAMEAATALVERLLPEATSQLTELYGEICDTRLLGEHLERMGESLGMTTVPLTPGGTHIMPPSEPALGEDLSYMEGQQEGGDEQEGVSRRQGGARAMPSPKGLSSTGRGVEEGQPGTDAGVEDDDLPAMKGTGGPQAAPLHGGHQGGCGEQGADDGEGGLGEEGSSEQYVTYRATSDDLT